MRKFRFSALPPHLKKRRGVAINQLLNPQNLENTNLAPEFI